MNEYADYAGPGIPKLNFRDFQDLMLRRGFVYGSDEEASKDYLLWLESDEDENDWVCSIN